LVAVAVVAHTTEAVIVMVALAVAVVVLCITDLLIQTGPAMVIEVMVEASH
jgi:hypothetical protein